MRLYYVCVIFLSYIMYNFQKVHANSNAKADESGWVFECCHENGLTERLRLITVTVLPLIFIYKENMQAAIKRHGDADILMMTSIPFHCLFMLYLPSVTRLFSSIFETIRNLVSNTKTHDWNNKIFLFIQFTLSCSCSTRKTKDSL